MGFFLPSKKNPGHETVRSDDLHRPLEAFADRFVLTYAYHFRRAAKFQNPSESKRLSYLSWVEFRSVMICCSDAYFTWFVIHSSLLFAESEESIGYIHSFTRAKEQRPSSNPSSGELGSLCFSRSIVIHLETGFGLARTGMITCRGSTYSTSQRRSFWN
jgi:hypothetical protein